MLQLLGGDGMRYKRNSLTYYILATTCFKYFKYSYQDWKFYGSLDFTLTLYYLNCRDPLYVFFTTPIKTQTNLSTLFCMTLKDEVSRYLNKRLKE